MGQFEDPDATASESSCAAKKEELNLYIRYVKHYENWYDSLTKARRETHSESSQGEDTENHASELPASKGTLFKISLNSGCKEYDWQWLQKECIVELDFLQHSYTD